jgi:hypothetical protein
MPQLWKEIGHDWTSIYKEMDANVSVSVDLKNRGLLRYPIRVGGISLFLILVVIALIINIPADLIPIWRRKQWAVFWFYLIIMAFAIVLTVCISLDIKLPSPFAALERVITAILGIE